MKRRKILIGASLVSLFAASAPLVAMAESGNGARQLAEVVEVVESDRIIGNADAPITIVEYASMTCPHCATFHKEIYPQIKEAWIDSGKARMVFRHFPLDALALRASGLAECMEGDRFFGFVDVLFATQANWSRSGDPLKALQGLAKQAGLSEAASRACLNDEATLRRILQQRQDATEKFDINSTPSFVINGEPMSGALSYEKFDSHLQGLLEDES